MELFDGDEPGNKHHEAASYSTLGSLKPAGKKLHHLPFVSMSLRQNFVSCRISEQFVKHSKENQSLSIFVLASAFASPRLITVSGVSMSVICTSKLVSPVKTTLCL